MKRRISSRGLLVRAFQMAVTSAALMGFADLLSASNERSGWQPEVIEAPQLSQRIRGLVMPRHHATLSSRLAATIEEIGPNNGERFAKGDTLVRFDCEAFEAEQARAQAQAEAASDALRVKNKLVKTGSISRLQAILARSEQKRAVAEVRVAEEKVRQCVIKAPFAGRVVRRIANAYETANFRDPLIEIVSDRDVEVRVFIPSKWVRTINVGTTFQFYVDETREAVTAKVVAIGAWIDNVSQLLEIRATVERASTPLIAGMSGNARFDAQIAIGADPAAASPASGQQEKSE